MCGGGRAGGAGGTCAIGGAVAVVVVVVGAAVVGSGKVIRVYTVRAALAFANLYGNDHESPVASTHHTAAAAA